MLQRLDNGFPIAFGEHKGPSLLEGNVAPPQPFDFLRRTFRFLLHLNRLLAQSAVSYERRSVLAFVLFNLLRELIRKSVSFGFQDELFLYRNLVKNAPSLSEGGSHR
jgi:hypothetical protein